MQLCTTFGTPQSAYQCCRLLTHIEYIDRRTYPGMFWAGNFSPSKLHLLHTWYINPNLIHGSWDAPESISQTASRSDEPFLHRLQQIVPLLFNGQCCAIVPRWRIFGDFLGLAFPASRVQHISDMHSKFALRPHHVWKYGRHPICDG